MLRLRLSSATLESGIHCEHRRPGTASGCSDFSDSLRAITDMRTTNAASGVVLLSALLNVSCGDDAATFLQPTTSPSTITWTTQLGPRGSASRSLQVDQSGRVCPHLQSAPSPAASESACHRPMEADVERRSQRPPPRRSLHRTHRRRGHILRDRLRRRRTHRSDTLPWWRSVQPQALRGDDTRRIAFVINIAINNCSP